MVDINLGKGPAECVAALKEVEDYVKSHFATEEKYMINYGYPDYDNHKLAHKKYCQNLEGLKAMYGIEGASNDFLRQFQLAVIKWWKNHIEKFDKQLAEFLRDKT